MPSGIGKLDLYENNFSKIKAFTHSEYVGKSEKLPFSHIKNACITMPEEKVYAYGIGELGGVHILGNSPSIEGKITGLIVDENQIPGKKIVSGRMEKGDTESFFASWGFTDSQIKKLEKAATSLGSDIPCTSIQVHPKISVKNALPDSVRKFTQQDSNGITVSIFDFPKTDSPDNSDFLIVNDEHDQFGNFKIRKLMPTNIYHHNGKVASVTVNEYMNTVYVLQERTPGTTQGFCVKRNVLNKGEEDQLISAARDLEELTIYYHRGKQGIVGLAASR